MKPLNRNSTDNEFGLKESDLKIIVGVLRGQVEVQEALIFGSRSKGNYKNGSDVDIALKGSEISFEIVARLNHLLNEETQMPYKFDLIDYNTIANSDLLEHINRVGRVIYRRE